MTDIIFKNIFLRKECRSYVNLLINSIFNIQYEDLNNKSKIKNNELYSDNVLNKSCYTDVIVTYKNIDVIIEMNKFKTKTILEKNNKVSK